MIAFDDLKFETDESTEHAHHFFDNHYGISVIRGPYTHGGRQGLYELAVLYMGPEDKYSELVYDTPVTSDVEGHLTPDDVTRLMEQVGQLTPRN